MMINLKSLRKIVDYDMVEHIGLVIDGNLVSVYPEKYELFSEIASKVYLTHLKIMRNSKRYLFLEIYASGERIVIYPLSSREMLLLHLNKDVNIELVIDEIIKTIGRTLKDRKVLL